VKACECGCGLPAPISQRTEPRYGAVKGQPRRFIQGHHRHLAVATAYSSIHDWLRRNCPKTGICEECGRRKRTAFALIHGQEYACDRSRYRELCYRCHNLYDSPIYQAVS
jgi:hypothetical protein